ncbi:putative cation efflux rotein [Gottschalkia acidurici 9a]|uniref:Cation efflux rotein n=1 Tax=Gottschalkia acidurici (strain ATCC 7906 / DSM 604 / BCRC 14475 / CIP 104303 / KCTC 5404 / NCIMB 10678 / 9a) TaxID=1128398 RepID=K0B2D6_GOTA9|nr:cation diffusion facilitator family transporter [Gottschalkia acidurici]AFS79095.1 putative cation efflux rotein [Gottschalkia acidurici 9a]
MVKEKNSYTEVRKVLAYILVLNLLVAIAKIAYGTITETASMVADGYHSFSDGTSNIVGLVGIWIASKPADDSHPYGHQKVETLSTIVISLLLFFVSFEIITNAYARFKNPVIPNINIGNFIVMIITLGINIFVVRYETMRGKQLKSSILISDAKHTQSDIYVSISVIVSLIAIKLGVVIVDSIVSIFIGVLIVKAGLEILLEATNVLIDGKMLNPEKIDKLVSEYPGVIYCHKIRTRGKENHIMVDLHVGVDPGYTISHAHEIAHDIEDMLKEAIDGVEEVIVHVEPAKLKEQ